MPGMQGDGERSLRSSTSPFWFLYNHDADVLERKNHRVQQFGSRGPKVFVSVERIQ